MYSDIYLPHRWFDYSRFGSPIDSTRIVAVKTPLKKVSYFPPLCQQTMCCGLCTVLASTRALDTLPASFSLSPSNSTLGWQPTTVGTTHGYSEAYPLKKSEQINYVAKQRELLVVVHCRFTPGQMLELFKERGWRVGLVIDLTYTNRYYEPQVSTQSPNIFKAPLTSITAKLCSNY